jgi:hypothetical protein
MIDPVSQTTVTGVHEFVFDESSTRFTDACCTGTFSGSYKPEGRLSEFVGTSFLNEWTLVVQDMKVDDLVGTVLSWSVEFVTSECFKKYEWVNMTSTMQTAPSQYPVSRYAAKALSYGSSLFIFGGRDYYDRVLNDLYRFDTTNSRWTKLTPVNFNVALDTASSIGSSFALTAWGLMRFGGYYRQPTLPEVYDNYINDNFLLDPVTLRWRKVDVGDWPQYDGTGLVEPKTRYYAAIVFVPSSAPHFRKTYSYRNLYDQYPRSTHANYANALADSLLMYGGHDGATGGTYDGSSGGLLGDLWMLRLANFSTSGQRYRQSKYMQKHCQWRSTPAAVSLGTTSCTSTVANTNCDFRDLLMLAWCSNTNQTLA